MMAIPNRETLRRKDWFAQRNLARRPLLSWQGNSRRVIAGFL